MKKTSKDGPASAASHPPEYAVVEPRCKVCQSEHRREIDIMLATGWPQATVVAHWNRYLRVDHLTANNVSTHARWHLTVTDPAIRRFVETCAARSQASLRECTPTAGSSGPPLARIQEAAEILARSGYAAIVGGLVVPEVKDMLAAIEVLGRLDANSFARKEAETRREVEALVGAVKAVLPPEMQAELLKQYERRLAEAHDSTPRPNSIP